MEPVQALHELDWWQSTRVGTADITCVPAQHFSARTPWDRNLTLWCGFVVRVDGVALYFAGDSGYTPQFREIGERCPSIDVALLPIGAYEPRWFMASVHMNPEEAVRAHLDVRARVSVGMHFGTFQLTDEAIDEPLRALDASHARRTVVTTTRSGVLDFGRDDDLGSDERSTGGPGDRSSRSRSTTFLISCPPVQKTLRRHSTDAASHRDDGLRRRDVPAWTTEFCPVSPP